MSAFFTDVFCAALKATPTLMNSATLKMYLFPTAPLFEQNDLRYTGVTTIAQLVDKLGWGNYATPTPAAFPVGTVDVTNNRYVVRDDPIMMDSAWKDTQISAVAFEYVGPDVGMANKLAFVTNRPLPAVIKTGDGITSQINPLIGTGTSGTRDLLGWSVLQATAGTTAQPQEGAIVLFRGPPKFEPAKTQHVWMYPQRVNLIANPSFETGMDYWRSDGAKQRIAGYAPGVGGGSFYGKFTSGLTPLVVESNTFPIIIRKEIPEGWTIQLYARGDGELKVGLITFPGSYDQVSTDWGPDDEEWVLSDTWRKVRSLRRIGEVNYGLLRLETNGTYLDIDHVCTEPGWLPENGGDWDYFDGDTIFGGEGDHTWYANKPHASYSCWVNHRSGVMQRLYAWDVVKGTTPDVITDEEARQQGLVYQWVPAGTPVTRHQDVLYVGDPCTQPQGVVGPVLPSQAGNFQASMFVTSPWTHVIEADTQFTSRDHPHYDDDIGYRIEASVTVADKGSGDLTVAKIVATFTATDVAGQSEPGIHT